MLFKFWGDNMDKKRGVRDVRVDIQGSLLHMYSILAGRSRVPHNTPSHTGHVSPLSIIPAEDFLPVEDDFIAIQQNLVNIVSKILTHNIKGLSVFAKVVPQHIQHQYSAEMAKKSEVIVLDVLMKNEACRGDMIDIMHCMQNYLGSKYPNKKKVLSGVTNSLVNGRLEPKDIQWMVIQLLTGLAFWSLLLKIGTAWFVFR